MPITRCEPPTMAPCLFPTFLASVACVLHLGDHFFVRCGIGVPASLARAWRSGWAKSADKFFRPESCRKVARVRLLSIFSLFDSWFESSRTGNIGSFFWGGNFPEFFFLLSCSKRGCFPIIITALPEGSLIRQLLLASSLSWKRRRISLPIWKRRTSPL